MGIKNGNIAGTVTVGEKGQIVIPSRQETCSTSNPRHADILADEKKGIAIPPKKSFAELVAKIFADNEEN
jgi:bifunctional DNA-binding transcriptional regulator/antitoxin component of YhaV-PrlF toxin-antitoxin module